MKSAFEVYFELFGDDFSINEVTKIVGLEPTKTTHKGELYSSNTSWILSSGYVENDCILGFQFVSDLIAKLKPSKYLIIKAMKRYNLKASLTVKMWITTDDSKPTPDVSFSEGEISFLSEICARINVNTYHA